MKPEAAGRISAVFSTCGLYRYLLTWVWDDKKPVLVWVLFNPSKAGGVDAYGKVQKDPTAMKGRGFSERWGYGGMIFVNCYAWISTNPAGLRAEGYPVGLENDAYILRACQRGTGQVVCAWGALGRGLARPGEVLKLLRGAGYQTMALGFTEDRLPRHPLMLSYDTPLEVFS